MDGENSPLSLLLAGDVVELMETSSPPDGGGCAPYWSCDKPALDEIEETVSTPRPSCSNTITTSNGKTVGVVSGTVRKLDVTTASTIRKTQVINQVSDIVRELVENSVDADSTNIQVFLSNFGLDEIIVQDTGNGISRPDLFHVVSGGYTSKLEDTGNLSAQGHYGFRGEALSSICSVANVCITTKTPTDAHATKYKLDNCCCIVSETIVAGGNGTHIVATDLFEMYPVRRGHIKEKPNCQEQLKKVESFLKSVAIANPKTHIRLFHNKSLIWSKASVGSIDQALMAVLGHAISKSLSRCGPVELEVTAEEYDEKKERTIEAFFLNKPVDMKTMSYTSRRMTFIFINRKRVHVHEFEKIIRQYTAATIVNPTPAERRRFPVAIININVPDDEVDFNREIDKTKVFLVHKDDISAKLEELLQKFYGITSLDNGSGLSDISGSTVSSTERNPTSPDIFDINEEISPFPFTTDAVSTNLHKERQSTIQSFIENIPTVSDTNFCQASIKTEGSVPFPSVRPSPPAKKSNQCISNFDCNLDDILMDTPPEEILPAVEVTEPLTIVRSGQYTINCVELEKSKAVSMKSSPINHFESSSKQDAITLSETGRVIDMNLWVQGRIPDNHGSILKSVNIVSSPCRPSNLLEKENVSQSSSASQHLNGCKNSKSTNAFDFIGSGLAKPSDAKRPKLSNSCNKSQKSANHSDISLSGTPRQITLNQFKNWDTPIAKRKSSSENIFRAPSPGLRLISPPASSSVSISATSFPAFQSSTQQGQDNFSGSQNNGRILGTLTDSSLYTVKINDFVGIFHPMNMLQQFPSLKYDLKIELQKVSQPGTELDAQYIVEKQCVPKLFNAFILRMDPMCDKYPKIFHKLQSLKDITF